MKFFNLKTVTTATAIVFGVLVFSPTIANPARNAIVQSLAAEAGTPFSPLRGKTLFESRPGGGKVKTPSCTSCHGSTPATVGKTRAGKTIKPMAVSRTPARFADPKKVAKWFRRNCKSVLGRECTALEKGDFLTYMISQ